MIGGVAQQTEDVCALPLVRRLAALLDRDPDTLRPGDALPRGWHVALFAAPTRQSELRADGLAGLGVTLPELGLPRIMAGGRQDYVMLPERVPGSPAAGPAAPPQSPAPAGFARRVVPDETMLLRYCAITYNTHRIHYDHPYATGVEGYPALVVNGGLPVLLLLDLFRAQAGYEPATLSLRNLAPLYCNRPIRLRGTRGEAAWRLWAEDDEGRVTVEATIA